jgi:hypothetical protein
MMPDLPKRYMANGKSNQEMRQAYNILFTEIINATAAISRYIGGVYIDRNMNGTQAYTPVPLADQKRAMSALSQYLFSPRAFDASATLYKNLQNQRRGFNFFGSPDDPKLHDRFLLVQANALDHLMANTTLERITDMRLYGNKYTASDMLQDLTNAIFKEDLTTGPNTIRQNLQIEYVKNLCIIASNSRIGDAYDYVAKSAAIGQLKTIRQMLATPATSAEVKAHREHLLLLIDDVFSKK